MAFSILSGILIAIITTLGEPRDLRHDKNWRVASAHKRLKTRSMYRCTVLFYVYLIVISSVFVAALLDSIMSPGSGIARWAERFSLSAGSSALFWSFGLPSSIRKIQDERLEIEVSRKRNAQG